MEDLVKRELFVKCIYWSALSEPSQAESNYTKGTRLQMVTFTVSFSYQSWNFMPSALPHLSNTWSAYKQLLFGIEVEGSTIPSLTCRVKLQTWVCQGEFHFFIQESGNSFIQILCFSNLYSCWMINFSIKRRYRDLQTHHDVRSNISATGPLNK